MTVRLLYSILILPGTVMVFIPAALVAISHRAGQLTRMSEPKDLQFWIAIAAFAVGVLLAVWTVYLQFTIGRGTPAPWDPPQALVIEGPYRFVRNPMILGAFCILLGESLLLQSWLIAGWWIVFIIGNLLYMPRVEEVGLERRFGEPYRRYKAHVPRWIPRRTPWGG